MCVHKYTKTCNSAVFLHVKHVNKVKTNVNNQDLFKYNAVLELCYVYDQVSSWVSETMQMQMKDNYKGLLYFNAYMSVI